MCPETLGELTDDTFKTTTLKLMEVAGIYYECRASILKSSFSSSNTTKKE